MNPNLEVKIGKMTLQNPLMGASGTFGFGKEYADFLDIDSIGAIVTKGITPLPRAGNPGVRVAETPAGMLNCIGLENPGIDAFISDILPKIKNYKSKIIVNISANTVEEYGEMAARLDLPDVDALEINISCPNVKEGGIVFGTDPMSAAAVTRRVRDNTSKTVITKLSPNVTDIVEMAQAVEEAGADALSLINTITGIAIDIHSRKPILGNITGGLSGPCIKPIALRMIWQTYQQVNIPIIGMGGITNGADAIEFLLAGATGLAVGAYNFVDPSCLGKIHLEVLEYMHKYGITDINELIGGLQIDSPR